MDYKRYVRANESFDSRISCSFEFVISRLSSCLSKAMDVSQHLLEAAIAVPMTKG